jgi:hypothetical protein
VTVISNGFHNHFNRDEKFTKEQTPGAIKKKLSQFAEETVQAFITKSIMETVRCLEDDMILSPNTGEPVCANYDLDEFLDATT